MQRPFLIAAALVAAFLLPDSVRAHSFYSFACCSDKDCTPVPDEAVTETERGWEVFYKSPLTGRLIQGFIERGSWRQKWSPDGRVHACEKFSTPEPQCIYVPPNAM